MATLEPQSCLVRFAVLVAAVGAAEDNPVAASGIVVDTLALAAVDIPVADSIVVASDKGIAVLAASVGGDSRIAAVDNQLAVRPDHKLAVLPVAVRQTESGYLLHRLRARQGLVFPEQVPFRLLQTLLVCEREYQTRYPIR